ncbi:MAG TPA: AMP-binding protein [Pseudomonadales bacterium]|nr:AMP-binding protein [Pseudomonadales bacterium]
MATARADDVALEENVLAIVGAVADELHPFGHVAVSLDASFDRELGFDSLARSELLLRVAEATRVQLPDELLATAERPRDLVDAVRASPQVRAAPLSRTPQTAVTPQAAIAIPATAATLVDALQFHVSATPQRVHVELYEGSSDVPRAITYAALCDGARRAAAGMQRAGIEPGSAVAIMLPTGAAYLEAFLGALLCGAVAVPIYPPERASQIEDHLRRHAAILDNAQARLLVAPARARPVARLLRDQVRTLDAVIAPEQLAAASSAFVPVPLVGDATAMLQYTSGSTGQPKGVVLTHAQLLANIRAMGRAVEATPADVFLSWLPLYHDMGLIGAWLGSLYYAMRFVLMPPSAFLGRPARWLTRLHEHRATISGAPNFAYELCVARVRDDEIAGIDLTRWRVAFNGAEPVTAATVRRFCDRYAAYGLRRNAMKPAYGLAEAGVCVALPPLEREPVVERIERDAYQRLGEARPVTDAVAALEFVSSGQALPGYELRVVDDSERELPDRREGRIEFRGPSATRGYMGNEAASRQLIRGEWLDTGDLGYVVAGDLFVTSRVKDLIKRAGRNIYPYAVEDAVGGVPGVRRGCVAAFGAADTGALTERLIVVAETTEAAPQHALLRERIEHVVAGVLGFAPDDVVLVRADGVPKTASGKIRRPDCRRLYERGELLRPAAGVRLQFVRLWWRGLRASRLRRKFADAAFAWRARCVFVVLIAIVWPLVVALPSPRLRWRTMQRGARWLLRLCGVPLTVTGADRVPRGPCVFVANHSSYLDAVVVAATVPMPCSFVVKSDLARKFFARLLLERIGATFVARREVQKSVADAHQLTVLLGRGTPLLMFPEGTLTRMPGLLPFHMGAFAAAVGAHVPVVPITIRGTRSILRADIWYAHRGEVDVEFGTPLVPDGTDWHAVVRLRDRTRAALLERLGEPDLASVFIPAPSEERS